MQIYVFTLRARGARAQFPKSGMVAEIPELIAHILLSNYIQSFEKQIFFSVKCIPKIYTIDVEPYHPAVTYISAGNS